jgi:hypothetical protein
LGIGPQWRFEANPQTSNRCRSIAFTGVGAIAPVAMAPVIKTANAATSPIARFS